MFGDKGRNIITGQSGAKGSSGLKGEPGFPGLQGYDGQPGLNGQPGPNGGKGSPGEMGVPGRMVGQIFALERNLINYLFFIGPESDHWECLSVTHSLTNSLTPVY